MDKPKQVADPHPTDEKARRELYNLRPAQQVLNLLSGGEVKELRPVFDLEHACRYPLVEQTCGLEPHEVPGLLDRMATHGILSSTVEERVLSCGKCGSVNVAVRYRCPFCRSFNLSKQRTMEHVSCRYIDAESRFPVKGSSMLCPRCGVEFRATGPDARERDSWFFCMDCNKRTKEPTMKFECRQCGTVMSPDDVRFTDLHSYTLAEGIDLGSLVLLGPVIDVAEKLGYRVENPGMVTGRSGTNHRFDVICKKEDDVVIAVDFVYSDVLVNEQSVITLFAKSYDSPVGRAILVAVPALTDQARKLAAQYRITTIEGSKREDVCQRVKEALVSPQKEDDGRPRG